MSKVKVIQKIKVKSSKTAFRSISQAYYLHKIIHKWTLEDPKSNDDLTLNVKGQDHPENEGQMLKITCRSIS